MSQPRKNRSTSTSKKKKKRKRGRRGSALSTFNPNPIPLTPGSDEWPVVEVPPVGAPERERVVIDFSEETRVDALGRLRTRPLKRQ